jgi:hypothetical protein
MNRLHLRLACLFSALAVIGARDAAQGVGVSIANRVEEDWQIVIANPDPVAVGPQITTCMSPTGDPSDTFVAFDLNYRDYPSFSPGGLQVKVCKGETVSDSDSQGSDIAFTPNESITWTQRMSLSLGSLSYSICNGQSTTWGQFGQGVGSLSVSAESSATSLAAYSPAYSVAKSGVGWQSDRVTSMKLLQVRYYSNNELISTDSTPRTVTQASQ